LAGCSWAGVTGTAGTAMAIPVFEGENVGILTYKMFVMCQINPLSQLTWKPENSGNESPSR